MEVTSRARGEKFATSLGTCMEYILREQAWNMYDVHTQGAGMATRGVCLQHDPFIGSEGEGASPFESPCGCLEGEFAPLGREDDVVGHVHHI